MKLKNECDLSQVTKILKIIVLLKNNSLITSNSTLTTETFPQKSLFPPFTFVINNYMLRYKMV